jgi:hypothetical protein
MTATTPVAFDPKPRRLGVVSTYTATSAILAGQIVSYSASGDDRAVVPATASTGAPIGVAAFSQATAGAKVTVYGPGCEVLIMLSADGDAADAGDLIGVSTVAGCGIVRDPAIQAHDTVVGLQNSVGLALDNIAAGAAAVGGKGYILIDLSKPVCAAS